jgi:hypothetical protein
VEKWKVAIERHKSTRSDAANIDSLKGQITKLGNEIENLKTLLSANVRWNILTDQETADRKWIGNIAPFSVTATVTETRDASKFLKFLADVFAASKTDIKTVLKNQFDPKTKAALKAAAEEAEAKRIEDANTKKTTALAAALDAQGKQITFDSLLPSASPAAVHQAEAELLKANLKAEIDCAAARSVGAEPIQCASY